MKKLSLIFLILICAFKVSFCQTINSKENEVLNAKNIIFYGYDFSDFQIADSKRVGQDLKKNIFTLIGFFQDHLSERKMQKWLEVDTVKYNLAPTLAENKKIDNNNIASVIKHNISKDSLQFIINKYQIAENEGIGYVVIFECFDNNTNRVSAYSVFFDIATKKPLVIDYVSKHDSNSFNRISDWNPVAFTTIKKLTDTYLERKELVIKK